MEAFMKRRTFLAIAIPFVATGCVGLGSPSEGCTPRDVAERSDRQRRRKARARRLKRARDRRLKRARDRRRRRKARDRRLKQARDRRRRRRLLR